MRKIVLIVFICLTLIMSGFGMLSATGTENIVDGSPAGLDEISAPYSRQSRAVGEVFIVSKSGQGDYNTISKAVDNADDGDIIYVWEGVYVENFEIDKEITLIGNNSEDTIIESPSSSEDVIHIEGDKITISGFTIRNGRNGVYLYRGASHNNITLCNITENTMNGIYLYWSPSNNKFIGNDIYSNDNHGIYFNWGADRNEIKYNRIIDNGATGIHFYWSCEWNIISNNLINNHNKAFHLQWGSENSLIYHNNILNNATVSFDDSSPNRWNDTYPTGGNFWAGWTSPDSFSGIDQDFPGADGVVDDQFEIDSDSIDYYPLTSQADISIPDSTPPVTEITFGRPNYGQDPTFITTMTRITLAHNGDLGGTGVDYSWYKFNSGDMQVYTGPIWAPMNTTEIEWGSLDRAGNQEVGNSINVIVDNDAPITVLNISSPKFGADPVYVTSSTEFAFEHNNDSGGVGVDFIWYKLNGGTQRTYSTPIKLSSSVTLVEWGSVDLLGHDEESQSISVFVDNRAPSTYLEIGSPSYRSLYTYVSLETEFTITNDGDNSGSGIELIWYRLNDGEVMNYSGPFTVLPNTTIIEWGSIDRLGNEENLDSQSIRVDPHTPITSIFVGNPRSSTTDPVYVTSSTTFSLSVTENVSGVKSTNYKIDTGGDWLSYYGSFNVDDQGEHTIYFYSVDNVENAESQNTLDIIVDDFPPSEPEVDPIPEKTSKDTVTVTGTAEPNSKVEVFLDDNLAGTEIASSDGDFSIKIDLNEGMNNITVRATDNLNRTSPNSPRQPIEYKKDDDKGGILSSGFFWIVVIIIVIIVLTLLFLMMSLRKSQGRQMGPAQYYPPGQPTAEAHVEEERVEPFEEEGSAGVETEADDTPAPVPVPTPIAQPVEGPGNSEIEQNKEPEPKVGNEQSPLDKGTTESAAQESDLKEDAEKKD
jgi:parallel beta-helix repeat protein